MLSYHNDPAVKEKFQLRFAAHRAADEVIQGTGFSNGRGCFVGCTLDNYNHSQFPEQLGWPEWLAVLADRIFEGLPRLYAPQFGTDLLAAVPVGVDLGPVQYHLAIARHSAQLVVLADNPADYAATCYRALQGVVGYCYLQLAGLTEEASTLALLARDRANSAQAAARSEGDFKAADMADSAAYSTADMAEDSARSANRTSAAAWKVERDTLLNVLRSMGGACVDA